MDMRDESTLDEIRQALYEAVENDDLPPSYNSSDYQDDDWNVDKAKVEELVQCFNPVDIVDSAGSYDDREMVGWLYERFEPDMVITNDGAVVIDTSLSNMETVKVWDFDEDGDVYDLEY